VHDSSAVGYDRPLQPGFVSNTTLSSLSFYKQPKLRLIRSSLFYIPPASNTLLVDASPLKPICALRILIVEVYVFVM